MFAFSSLYLLRVESRFAKFFFRPFFTILMADLEKHFAKIRLRLQNPHRWLFPFTL
jgi:hypothetical protein